MSRARWLQETKHMRFEEAYSGWTEGRLTQGLTQEEATQLLGVCDRSFRRYINRYHDSGLDGLTDKRLDQASHRQALTDEVLALEALYRERYDGWTVKHFFERYESSHQGQRSYSWAKQQLQSTGLVRRGKRKGKHRKRRDRAALPGMLIH